MSDRRLNCPTSRRTGQGDCGEVLVVGGIAHSCKFQEYHEGSHMCNCEDPMWVDTNPIQLLNEMRELLIKQSRYITTLEAKMRKEKS